MASERSLSDLSGSIPSVTAASSQKLLEESTPCRGPTVTELFHAFDHFRHQSHLRESVFVENCPLCQAASVKERKDQIDPICGTCGQRKSIHKSDAKAPGDLFCFKYGPSQFTPLPDGVNPFLKHTVDDGPALRAVENAKELSEDLSKSMKDHAHELWTRRHEDHLKDKEYYQNCPICRETSSLVLADGPPTRDQVHRLADRVHNLSLSQGVQFTTAAALAEENERLKRMTNELRDLAIKESDRIFANGRYSMRIWVFFWASVSALIAAIIQRLIH